MKVFYFILFTLVLSLNYYYNPLGIINNDYFENIDKRDESMIIARMAVSESEGVFSHHLFNGYFANEDFEYNKSFFYLMKPYDPEEFILYYSQPGGQSFMYSLLTKWIPVSNELKWNLVRGMNIIAFSALLFLLVFWLYREFNLVTAILVYIFFIIAPFFILFAKSPWWCLFSFYMPMILLFQYLLNKEISTIKLNFFLIFLILLKIFLTGFEFILPFLSSLLIPIIYYHLKSKFRLSVRFLFQTTLVLFGGVIIGVFLLVAQISLEKGGISQGIELVSYSFAKRSHGISITDVSIEKVYVKSYQANLVSVINKYLSRPVFVYNGTAIPILNYYGLFVLNYLAGCILFFRGQRIEMFILSLIGFLGSISWFIIFKGHASIHGHLDEMALYLPWVLLTMINLAYFISVNYKLLVFNKKMI